MVNKVQYSGIPVTFYVSASGDSSITASFESVDNNGGWFMQNATVMPNQYKAFEVKTDHRGIASLTISSTAEAAAAIVQADSKVFFNTYGYNTVLSAGPDRLPMNEEGLTQINFGSGWLSYIPENSANFEPTSDNGEIGTTKAVVGNPQYFAIISNVEWPSEDFGGSDRVIGTQTNGTIGHGVPDFDWSDGINTWYANDCDKPAVRDLPLTVTTDAGGQIYRVNPTTTDTDDNLADINGNKVGISHWYAISNVIGYQWMNPFVDGTNLDDFELWLNGEEIPNVGVTNAAGFAPLNISIQWLAKTAVAVRTTPEDGTYSTNYKVPVTVKVTDKPDGTGNPIANQSVRFALNTENGSYIEEGGIDSRLYTLDTDANGIATVHVIFNGNPEGDLTDQVAMSVYNNMTDTKIYFNNGTYTADQNITWGPALIEFTNIDIGLADELQAPQVDSVLTAVNLEPADATVTY